MDLKVGDFVQWNTSGGTARGQISRIVREGVVAVPKSSFKITAEPDDPAVLITLYRPNNNENGYMRQDVVVGHKMSTLKKIEPLNKEQTPMDNVEKRQYNTQQRRDMAERGEALPDGSFPIADKADLGNALQAIGRASNRALAMAHIRKRAKDLDAMDMLPDWAMMKALETDLAEADIIVLADLRHHADATDDQWSLVIDEVAKAGGVRQTGGYAAEVIRKSAAAMAAAATAAQMSGKGGKSFGGNRSAAGRYAAEQRWARSRGQGAGEASGGGGAAGGGGSGKNPLDDKSTVFHTTKTHEAAIGQRKQMGITDHPDMSNSLRPRSSDAADLGLGTFGGYDESLNRRQYGRRPLDLRAGDTITDPSGKKGQTAFVVSSQPVAGKRHVVEVSIITSAGKKKTMLVHEKDTFTEVSGEPERPA